MWIQLYQISEIPLHFIYFLELACWFCFLTTHFALAPRDLKLKLGCYVWSTFLRFFLIDGFWQAKREREKKKMVDGFEQESLFINFLQMSLVMSPTWGHWSYDDLFILVFCFFFHPGFFDALYSLQEPVVLVWQSVNWKKGILCYTILVGG